MDPPDIDSKLCNAFEDKITFQLYSFTGDSDSEEDNYYEWEAVGLKLWKNCIFKFFKCCFF